VAFRRTSPAISRISVFITGVPHSAEQAIKTDPVGESLPILRGYSDPWGMDKDGKIHFDPVKYRKLMRK